MTRVADEILSYCTSCRMDLTHVVVAMKGDRAVKVQCKTCQGMHTYRAPKGIDSPAKAPKKRVSKAEAEKIAVADAWDKLSKSRAALPGKAYSPKSSFKIGDKISHPTFGEGFVEKLIHPNKMEIMFQHDVKILIHAGASAVPVQAS